MTVDHDLASLKKLIRTLKQNKVKSFKNDSLEIIFDSDSDPIQVKSEITNLQLEPIDLLSDLPSEEELQFLATGFKVNQ